MIDINSETLRLNLSLSTDGRLRIEIERDELTGNTNGNSIPFEITSGNVLGKNYYGRLNFDYKLAANLQSSMSYEGRNQGGGKMIHTARAEVRAFFLVGICFLRISKAKKKPLDIITSFIY